MPTSVRLDPATEQLLQRLARQSARTRSDVIRTAIEMLADREALASADESPAAAAADLVGCVSGGPPDLSTDTGRKLQELLAKRPK